MFRRYEGETTSTSHASGASFCRRNSGGRLLSCATGRPWRVRMTSAPCSTSRINFGSEFFATAMPTLMTPSVDLNEK
jgi:hypothetical protein